MDMNRRNILAVVVIICIAITGIYYVQFRKAVEVGDTILVNYTAYLDTGEIIDTSFEEIAYDDTQPKVWWFRLRASYEPLKVEVGQGNLLPDFEIALVGMHVGEKKEITIPPERAYGFSDSSKIVEFALVRKLKKEEEVPRAEFADRLMKDPVAGEHYQFQGFTILVTEVTEDVVKFRYELQVGQEIYIGLGNAIVTGEDETEFEISLNPTLGDVISYSYYGQGTIIELTEDAMVVDFNSPLAGETLHYTIWIVEIQKAG
jgi:FKBP-type peptidyl-prolyl cis-trans isomerase 2